MENITREDKGIIRLGEKVVVSDPCYGLGTWCQGVLDSVLPGNYKCTVEYFADSLWGKRVSAISVCHEDYVDNRGIAPEYDAEPFEVGVDSGQAGIFDYEYFKEHQRDLNENNENWYGRVCRLTYDGKRFLGNTVDKSGLVSSSGYGDGGYTCWTAKNPDGKIYSILVEFITKDDGGNEDI